MNHFLHWLTISLSLVAGLTATAAMAASGDGGTSSPAVLYQTHCADCHGNDGRGVAGIDDLRQGLSRPDPDIVLMLERGQGTMPAYQGLLSRRELLDIVAYVRRLRW